MFRLNLFYGLLILVTLLWTVGASSILLMRQADTANDADLVRNHESIDAALKVITVTSTLNAHYLPVLARGAADGAPDRELWESLNPRFDEALGTLREGSPQDTRWDDLLNRFADSIGNFREAYEGIFSQAAPSPAGREAQVELINSRTQAVADLSGNIIAHVDRSLMVPAAGETLKRNTIFVMILLLLGTMISILIYFGLSRRLVEPVVSLLASIDEIRRGNYELTISEPGGSSEFSPVVSAFNDMVKELRIRRGENAESLARANTVTRSILEAIPSPVFIMEDDSGGVLINPAAEKLSEKLGVMGRLPDKIQQLLNECVRTDSSFMPDDPRDALLFRIQEVEYYYLPRIFRFKGSAPSKPAWAVLLHNVTRIRWLDDMKTNLLSTVSHEIKTPLTGIRMVLHLLLEDRRGTLDETQRKMIASANDDSERLLLTLNALLELARAESGTTQLNRVPTRLADHVERALRLHADAARGRSITLSPEFGEGDFPDVSADGLRLDAVINNLLSNAIKHSPDGGDVRICLSKPDADHVRVSFIDHGLGVPEGSKSRIFERFYRAPDLKHEGVGLGLFISREIMRAHEGRIGIHEREDNLTEFYFDVPIA